MLVQMVMLLTIVLTEGYQNYDVIYQWNLIEPEWPNEDARKQSLADGSYIPENNPITGIKVWKNQLYLTVPRWKNGVPATLAVISAVPSDDGSQNLTIVNQKLKPFPNWEMQTLGDCKAFQFVQSMEIDPQGRMWIIDNGRTAIWTDNPNNNCPPRLVILDLEAHGTVLRNYVFPTDVLDYKSAFLNDIVLDHEHGGFAYITDNGKIDPGLIVYSLASDSCWKVRHATMKVKDYAKMITVNDVTFSLDGPIDRLALSPSSSYDRMVYYSPLSSFHIYVIPTRVLKSGYTNATKHVRKVGRKSSQSDGMIMSSTGILFFGSLENNSINYWNSSSQNVGLRSDLNSTSEITEHVLAKDDNVFQWPDTFAIDENGSLWCVSNRLQNFINNKIDQNAINYRLIKMQ